MKPSPFYYHAPASLDECLALLAQYQDDAALIAGGQSLVPLMRFRLAQPAHVIAIRNIGGALKDIRRTDAGLVIGAGVTYVAAQRSADVKAACPGLADAIDLVSHPAVRTRGTICGNLCQADPASELPALMLVLDATFRLRSASGERTVAAKDFFVGPYTTARNSDEMLTEIVIPGRPAAGKVVLKEVTRLRGGFPLAGIAVAIVKGGGTAITSAAVACFGVHSHQTRIPGAEEALKSGGCTPAALAAAAKAIDDAIEPHGDPFGSAEYRRAAVRTLFERAMKDACEGAAA